MAEASCRYEESAVLAVPHERYPAYQLLEFHHGNLHTARFWYLDISRCTFNLTILVLFYYLLKSAHC